MPQAIAILSAILSCVGIAQTLAGWLAVRRFAARLPAMPAVQPRITILKPLHGNEPLLEQALASLCRQDYPGFQVVFGVQNPADPAIAVVERLRAALDRKSVV